MADAHAGRMTAEALDPDYIPYLPYDPRPMPEDPYAGIDFGEPQDYGFTAIPATRNLSKGPIRSRLLTMAQMANLPDPEPLIRGTLDLGTVVVLAGYWGTLKSFIALDWAASIATGRNWQARPCQKRKVLYIAGEGAHGIYSRLNAWQVGWKRTIGDENLALLPRPVNLTNPIDVLELCNMVSEDGYGVVFIDTVSKSIPGADENSAKDMSLVVSHLYEIQAATNGGTVIAVHHTGKDKTTIRGSSALEAGVDTVYITEGGPTALTMKRTKRKDGPTEDTLELKFAETPGTGSGVVERQGGRENHASADALLSHFQEHFSETGATRREILDTCGLPESTAYRSLNDLVRNGFLVNTGTPSRPRYTEVGA